MLECNISYKANKYFGSDYMSRKFFRLYLVKEKTGYCAYLNCNNCLSFSSWDQGQIGIKFGTKHVIYQKFASFSKKRGIYVNRFENVFFDM